MLHYGALCCFMLSVMCEKNSIITAGHRHKHTHSQVSKRVDVSTHTDGKFKVSSTLCPAAVKKSNCNNWANTLSDFIIVPIWHTHTCKCAQETRERASLHKLDYIQLLYFNR